MNIQKICEALADWPEEKQGTRRLFNMDTGCYCALGWLGHKIGIEDTVLAGISDPEDDKDDEDADVPYAHGDLYSYIALQYGMERMEYEKLYEANDSYTRTGHKTPKEAVQQYVGCEVSANG
jgi:hypothetical protein